MRRSATLFLAVALTAFAPLSAQRPSPRPNSRPGSQPEHNRPRANQGRIPPAPPRGSRGGQREPERFDGGRLNSTPHVSHDHWYGHDLPNERRFQLARPFEHGRFQHIGSGYRYQFARVDPGLHRLWLPGGLGFEVAAWDWPLAADWCWDCDDDFVVYDDVDHPGWYLVYNIHTGQYIHAQYMGQ
jgi:hypothetical protein